MSDREAARARKAFWQHKQREAERLAAWDALPDRVPLVEYKRAKCGGIWL